MRKLILLMIVLAFGVLNAGAQETTIPETLPEGVTIQYWHQYNNEFQQATINALVDEFNTSNEWGITVEATPQGSYNDIRNLVNSAIQSGDLPNIIPGFPNDALSYALEPNLIVDLNPYVSDPNWGLSEEELTNLNEAAFNAWVFDGEPHNGARLGWVNQISGAVLFYNPTMIEALGFEAAAPQTLEELEAIACAAANTTDLTGAEGADVQGYPIVAEASQFESFVAGIGGGIWNAETGMWDFTSEEVITILELYKRLYDAGCAYIPAEQFGNTADFARATNPFAISSTAGIAPTNAIVEEAGVVENWTLDVTPANGGTPVIQLYTPGIMMVSATPEEQLATWLFMKYFTSPEVQAQWATALSLFPANNAAVELIDETAYFPGFYEMIQRVGAGEVSVYVSPQRLSYGQVRSILAQGIADVTSGGLDVQEVAERMTEEANAALADEGQ